MLLTNCDLLGYDMP